MHSNIHSLCHHSLDDATAGGARGTRCIRGRSPVVESVAVTVSGGGTTAGPVHLTEIWNYLHLTVSPSPVHFTFAFSVFACTSHEPPCVMSSFIPPPLHAHIPYCIPLLSGPSSDSIFRVRAPGSDSIFRVRVPGSNSFFSVLSPGSDSIF